MDEKLHPRETFPRQQAAPTSEKALVCISDVMGTQLGRTCKNHQGNGWGGELLSYVWEEVFTDGGQECG